jgi:hypothetical protein
MALRYRTPRELIDALDARVPEARTQCWDLLRPALERLMATWIERHGLHLDRELLGLHVLHFAETYLRTRPPGTFDAMSWNAFRAMAVVHVAQSAFRPLDGSQGLAGPGPLPESPGYQSEIFFRPYERLADAWFGGDWYAGWKRPDGSLWVLLADVTGHGYHAHLLACALPGVWQRCWADLTVPDPEPMQVLHVLHELLADCLPEGIFLECTLARLAPDGTVTVGPAGATRLLLRRAQAQHPDLVCLRGGWLGLRIPEAEDQQSWVLEDGDELLLATDGLFDQLEEFDWSEQVIGNARLFDAVRQLVEQALDQGPQRDDLTMVLVRRCILDAGPPAPASSEENLSSFSAGGSR